MPRGDYVVWDAELPGFGLRVWPSGKRAYIAQYSVRDGSAKLRLADTVKSLRKKRGEKPSGSWGQPSSVTTLFE